MPPANDNPLPPTTQLASLTIRHEWEGRESEGQTIAREYDLAPARPVMEDNQTLFTIFESDGKFYLWQRIDDDVFEIACRDIREIACKISQSQFREQRTSLLPRSA
ncbi:unnamed protein product [Penicillium glandicola]